METSETFPDFERMDINHTVRVEQPNLKQGKNLPPHVQSTEKLGHIDPWKSKGLKSGR